MEELKNIWFEEDSDLKKKYDLSKILELNKIYISDVNSRVLKIIYKAKKEGILDQVNNIILFYYIIIILMFK